MNLKIDDKQYTKGVKNIVPKGSGGIQSIHRAIRLVKVVADGEENGMRLTDICSVVDLKTTTVFRLLASLVDEGMLVHDNLTKHYTLGLELARMGTRAKKILIVENCRLAIENVCRQSEDTVFLFERTGTLCQCIKRMEGPYPVRTLAINEGDFRPLGIGAGSLAIFASLPENLIARILKVNMKYYAQYGQTREKILELINLTSDRGYSWADRQVSGEVSAVGVAIHNRNHEVVGAISVAAIPKRLKKERREKIVEVIKTEIAGIDIP